MKIPEQLLNSLNGIAGFNRETFEKAHTERQALTSIRVNPLKNYKPQTANYKLAPVPWSDYGYYLPERPSFTFDPLFHAGCYYVQEASSMFIEQALKQLVELSQPIKVLDLSAAPGGKSTHIQSLISSQSVLVSNEVIRSRASVLKANIIKWGASNVIVTNNDPVDFGKLENYFDIVVVDAPCSGSGLFRRDPDSIHEWSENNVQLCSQRQQRILADVWPSLKKDGLLIYSTCSYSEEENEDIGRWLINDMGAKHQHLTLDDSWGIIEAEFGYRFWPDKVSGEGFYLACFQKPGGAETSEFCAGKDKLVRATKNELLIIKDWVSLAGNSFLKHNQTFYCWPDFLVDDFQFLIDRLRFVYSGVLIGEIIRDKFIPSHALAMSKLISEKIPHIELDQPESIKFLQRRPPEISPKQIGWQLVTYKGFPLGWINVLKDRINNYYPKELRIIKNN